MLDTAIPKAHCDPVTQLPIDGIGQRVAQYRRRNGWSAQRLADNTDGLVSRSTIANLESGRRTDLGLRQFLAICLALRIPPAALLVDLHDPFSPAQVGFPGPAPASLEPAAPQAALALWLNGNLPDSSTAASRHVHQVLALLAEYLETGDKLEADVIRERLAGGDGYRHASGASAARRAELAAALRADGVRLPVVEPEGTG